MATKKTRKAGNTRKSRSKKKKGNNLKKIIIIAVILCIVIVIGFLSVSYLKNGKEDSINNTVTVNENTVVDTNEE